MRRMNEAAGHYPGLVVSVDKDELALEREFEQAVRAASDLAVRVAFSVLRRREDAEDVAQDVFARAYVHFPELREPARFRGWIVRATWRLAIDHWRADRRRLIREQSATEPTSAANAEQLAVERQRSARLWQAIDNLPEKLRVVIVLCALQGHDVQEVAQLLEIPEGTVKSRLFLARKQLAERLTCLVNDSAKR
jgi:RNA polymerase sigma-70 factor (ECF subfamily)